MIDVILRKTGCKTFGRSFGGFVFLIKSFKMKKITFSLSLSILLVAGSCTTTVVSAKKRNSVESVVESGKSYLFIKKDGTKERLRIIDLHEGKITGKTTLGETLTLEVNNVAAVRKNSTVKTLLLTSGIIAAVLVIPAYYNNTPVMQN